MINNTASPSGLPPQPPSDMAADGQPQTPAYQPDLAKLQRYVDVWASMMNPATNQALLCCQMYDGEQLTAAERNELGARGQPAVIMNRIKPAVNGIVGVIEKGRTDPKGLPREPTDEESANLATDVLRYIADVNRFQIFKARSFSDELRAGWTGSITEIDEDGEVVVQQIRWEELIWDPAARANDARDGRFLGIGKWMYVDDLQAEYPDLKEEIGNAFSASASPVLSMEDRPFGGFGWIDTNTRRAMVVELYHREAGVWQRCKFIRSLALEYGPSAYLDKKGRPRCPIEAVRAYVDQQNRPYGVVVDMMDPQREINARRSWMLRALAVRQAMVQPGAVADLEDLRRQLARTDGLVQLLIPNGVEIIDRNTDIAGQSALLQEAKAEIDRQAPNPALQGRQAGDQSGRALIARQQAGLLELAPVLSAFEEYIMRVYRQMWQCAVQFWKKPKYIRITNDAKAPDYLQINEPVAQQVMDPITGAMMSVPAMKVIQGPDGQPVQVPVTKRTLAELDVDIIVDSSPDVAAIEQEQFEALMQLYPAVAAVNPAKADILLDAIIANSSVIRDKASLLQNMKGPQEPDPMQQMQQQLAMQGAQIELAKGAAEVQETQASAALKKAQTLKTGMEAANIHHQTAREEAGEDNATQDRNLQAVGMRLQHDREREAAQREPPPG